MISPFDKVVLRVWKRYVPRCVRMLRVLIGGGSSASITSTCTSFIRRVFARAILPERGPSLNC